MNYLVFIVTSSILTTNYVEPYILHFDNTWKDRGEKYLFFIKPSITIWA